MPRIEKIVRAFAPDVIHVQYPSVTFSRWPFVNLLPHLLRRRFRGVPVVVTLHEYHDATFPGRLRLWFTALGSDATIVSNEEDQQRLAHRGLKRLCTFPLGNLIPVQAPSAARAAAVRQQYNIQSKDLVGFVGMIDRDKRIEILLEATARLPTRPAILLLAGFDAADAYHQSLRKRSSELGLEVYWPGYLPNEAISTLLQECQLTVFPFRAPVSARRSTFIASLLHGLPTIATGSNNHVFRNEVNCMLIREMNAQTLADCMTRLRADAPLRAQLGREARKLASQFDWTGHASAHVALYKELCSM
jgi:glycosyltransferase involved in cell wall biosynthesis